MIFFQEERRRRCIGRLTWSVRPYNPRRITYKGGKEEKPYVITYGQVEEHTSLSYMFQQLCWNLKMEKRWME
jgi:hypothetical protein